MSKIFHMHSVVRALSGVTTTFIAASIAMPVSKAGGQAPVGTPVTVITSEDIKRRNISQLDELFQGLVPGFITVDRGAASRATWQGRGIRGVEAPTDVWGSLIQGAGTPMRTRVFLNGAEIPDASYINRINPEYVERIEVSSGFVASAPEGAAGGVIRIFTKRGGNTANANERTAATVRPSISTLISAGSENSLYNENASLTQRHAINLTGGPALFGYFLGGGYTANGDYAPHAKARSTDAILGLSSTSRFVSAYLFGAIGNKMFNVPSPRRWVPDNMPARSQTQNSEAKNNLFGGTVALTLTPWWRQELRGGNSFGDERTTKLEIIDLQEDRRRISDGGAETRRNSFAYITSFTLPTISVVRPTIRAGYEHLRITSVNDTTVFSAIGDGPTQGLGGRSARSNQKIDSYFATLGMHIGDLLAIDAGVRGGKDYSLPDDLDKHLLPYVSTAFTFSPAAHRVTTRFAYGQLQTRNIDPRELTPTLTQRFIGTEGGVDFQIHNGPTLSVTMFDQHGDQVVDIGGPVVPSIPPRPPLLTMVALRTKGTELSAQWSRGPFDAKAAFTVAKTKVDEVDPTYPGRPSPYEAGQTYSDYPRQTGGFWLAYTRWQTTFGVEARYLGSHVDTNYLADGSDPDVQRTMRYTGSGRYNLTVSRPLIPNVMILGYVNNLTNEERYGTTNAEYVRGRQIGLGVRANY